MITLQNCDELEFPWEPIPDGAPIATSLTIDTEFTDDGVFNIGATRIIHSPDGKTIYQLEKAFDMYADLDIEPWLEKYTGISQDFLTNKEIDWEVVQTEMNKADYVIAHSVWHDRSKIEQYIKPECVWLCTFKDITWLDHGIKDTNLANILQALGYYSKDKHQAYIDSKATAIICCEEVSGQTVLSHMIGGLEEEFKVSFFNTPYETKDLFRGQRFTWDFHNKSYNKIVRESDLPEVLETVTTKLNKVVPNKDFTSASHLSILPVSKFDRHK